MGEMIEMGEGGLNNEIGDCIFRCSDGCMDSRNVSHVLGLGGGEEHGLPVGGQFLNTEPQAGR